MDLHSGYWQVKVKEEDQAKAAHSPCVGNSYGNGNRSDW
jgi:hypothetical protein